MTEFTDDDEIQFLRKALVRESNSAVMMRETLTQTQARCTQLVHEKRFMAEEIVKLRLEVKRLSQGIVLPGWTCQNKECGVFNSEAKEIREVCRACDKPYDRMVESSV